MVECHNHEDQSRSHDSFRSKGLEEPHLYWIKCIHFWQFLVPPENTWRPWLLRTNSYSRATFCLNHCHFRKGTAMPSYLFRNGCFIILFGQQPHLGTVLAKNCCYAQDHPLYPRWLASRGWGLGPHASLWHNAEWPSSPSDCLWMMQLRCSCCLTLLRCFVFLPSTGIKPKSIPW